MSTSTTTASTSTLRLLILTPSGPRASTLIPPLLQALTGRSAPQDLSTFAGYTSHPPLQLRTRYYNADVSIWVDEVPLRTSSRQSKAGDKDQFSEEQEESTLEQWKEQMLSAEAREVREAIGGILLVLPTEVMIGNPSSTVKDLTREELLDVITTVGTIRDEIETDRGNDCAACVVLQKSVMLTGSSNMEDEEDRAEKLEDKLLDSGVFGWDIVTWNPETSSSQTEAPPNAQVQREGSRKDGSEEKTGIDRILEILEVVSWSAGSNSTDLDLDFLSGSEEDEARRDDYNEDDDILKPDEQELQREMLGLSMALRREDRAQESEGVDEEDLKIESLPGLMERVMALREKGSSMPGEEREKFAKKAIADLVGEL
ncbi:MAG: hypothetical protein Q9227_009453 [Pyrenula ochraceoflavens]